MVFRSPLQVMAIAFLLTQSGWAVRPINQFQDLVAGRGKSGFKDGSFIDARFNNPVGLALDEDNHWLFVADRSNNRVRLIHLEDKNRVETLAGTGQAGQTDGPFDKATFNQPTWVVRVANGNLVVYDMESKLFRFLDMKKREVSTLVSQDPIPLNLTEIWAVAYDPGNNSLYYTQPNYGRLSRFDLTTLKSTLILNGEPRIPNPLGLALDNANLYVADNVKNMVYSLPTTPAAESGPASALQEVGPATQVIAMTFSSGSLYALESASPYLVSLKPARTVELVSIWGDSLESTQREYPSLFITQRGQMVGFIGGAKDEKRFFVTGAAYQEIVTFWDYEYDKYKKFLSGTPDELNDLNYPATKPANTFRILILGDSHIFSESPIMDAKKWPEDTIFNRMESPAKRLELMLNTEAALSDAPLSYQVLCMGFEHGAASPPFIWSYYKVPAVAEKYGIDLVLYVTTPYEQQDYETFYFQRMNADGIPEGKLDTEYYLQPIEKRIPPGLPNDLYRLCVSQKLIQVDPKTDTVFFDGFNHVIANSEAKKDLQTLMGRPLGLLKQKLEKGPEKARLEICFIPVGDFESGFETDDFLSFWSGLSDQWGIPFLDLTEPFLTLRTTYYPLMCVEDNVHFSSKGHEVMAYLLARELIRKNIISFSSHDSVNSNKQK